LVIYAIDPTGGVEEVSHSPTQFVRPGRSADLVWEGQLVLEDADSLMA